MNIDKTKKVFVIDIDNHLYDFLKDEYEFVKHSNFMEDFLLNQKGYDLLFVDLLYKDGDIFELVKKSKIKPVCIEEVTPLIKSKLEKKVDFLSKKDLLVKEHYISIEKDLVGYEMTLKILKLVLKNNELLGDMKALYGKFGASSTVEKNIRYYKECLFDGNILESDIITFNKTYPTNTEFFRILIEMVKKQKIKVE